MDFATRAIHVGREPDPSTRLGRRRSIRRRRSRKRRSASTKDTTTPASRTRRGRRSRSASRRSRTPPTATRSRRAGMRRPRSCTCSTPVTTSSPSTTSTAGRTGCSRRCTSRRVSLHVRDAQELSSDADSLVGDARLVWIETPTNPLLNLVDIAAVARATKAAGALLVVDNTFATPYLQRPLDLGGDIVLLDDEIPRRPLRRHRRVRRDERSDDRRAPALPRSRSAPSRARWTRGSSFAA